MDKRRGGEARGRRGLHLSTRSVEEVVHAPHFFVELGTKSFDYDRDVGDLEEA